MDVNTLYSSIPHSDGIKACEIFMTLNCFPSTEISSITKIKDFIFTHNYFEFNDKSYIQTHGTAILKKVQTYLCGALKKYLLDNCTDKPFLYLRCIDDIFAIWQHGEYKLEQLHAYVNNIHPNINPAITSYIIHYYSIHYLDVSVSFDGTNILTSIYTKSTDRHGCLHYKGFHPIPNSLGTSASAPTNSHLNIKHLIYSKIF